MQQSLVQGKPGTHIGMLRQFKVGNLASLLQLASLQWHHVHLRTLFLGALPVQVSDAQVVAFKRWPLAYPLVPRSPRAGMTSRWLRVCVFFNLSCCSGTWLFGLGCAPHLSLPFGAWGHSVDKQYSVDSVSTPVSLQSHWCLQPPLLSLPLTALLKGLSSCASTFTSSDRGP